MKTITIGDIHGLDLWKDILFGSSYEYRVWREAYVNGAPLNWDPDVPFLGYDKIIFIGDYTDSFDISSPTILKNLKEIIELKKILEHRVVLLLGNHDVQYFVKGQGCSGYRPEMKHDLEEVFLSNEDLFQLAFQDGNYLWTHAGVSSAWLDVFRKELYEPTMRFSKILREESPVTIAGQLNLGFRFRLKSVFNVDWDSGGRDSTAGPLWIRPGRLNRESLPINQVVGHTVHKEIAQVSVGDYSHWYIDVLPHGATALKLDTADGTA